MPQNVLKSVTIFSNVIEENHHVFTDHGVGLLLSMQRSD